MTLNRWLAPEVAYRVRAEYAAHVQEAEQPKAEAVAALDDPEGVAGR